MAFPHLLIIQPLAESAQTTQPGNDYVTVLQSILDKHAPKGSKIALRKYVPATHKFKKFGKISRYDYGALRARHTSNFTHYRDAERRRRAPPRRGPPPQLCSVDGARIGSRRRARARGTAPALITHNRSFQLRRAAARYPQSGIRYETADTGRPTSSQTQPGLRFRKSRSLVAFSMYGDLQPARRHLQPS